MRLRKLPQGYEAWVSRQRGRERRDDPGHASLPPLRGTLEGIIERLQQFQAAGMRAFLAPLASLAYRNGRFCAPLCCSALRCCRIFVRWKRLWPVNMRAVCGTLRCTLKPRSSHQSERRAGQTPSPHPNFLRQGGGARCNRCSSTFASAKIRSDASLSPSAGVLYHTHGMPMTTGR